MRYAFFIVFCVLFFSPSAAQQQFSVYFESDKYDLAPRQEASLDSWIKSNPEVKIVGIHGFCDEDGTSGYNDTLAKNRINHVYNKLAGRIKIRDDFKTRSFGELHQLSKIKAENRKVTLFYLESKDLPRENEILGIKPEPPAPKKEKRYPEKISIKNPNGTSSEYKLDVGFMKKIDEAKAGEKLKIENLNFQINTFAVMPESRGKMYELLIVMQDNPALKIDIQGHLCCMPVDRVDLSTQRAKAIYNFLVANEIEKKRLSYKGFGSTQPIYPLPEKTEAERAANRRVEILIVEN
jgi:outer membrane protein OmpA-like peptidoglycan-associated protein